MNATKRVLVVDDDPVVGLAINRILTGKGYAVMSARNGPEALDRLAREDYDVVYTDIRMPGMDGLEVARRIKASRPWLPVLIVTGYGTEENEAAAEDIGVARFLRKPLTPDSIEESAAYAVNSPYSAWAPIAVPTEPVPVTEKPAATPEKPAAKGGLGLFAKNVGLFFAAPVVALFYVVIGPFVGLGLLAYTGYKAWRSRK